MLKFHFRATACFVLVGILLTHRGIAQGELVVWSGAGAGNSWSTPANWGSDTVPGSTDTALFEDAGGAGLPGEITNTLNGDHILGGLAFSTGSTFHTTNLNGRTLTVWGNVNFNTNQPMASQTTLRDGVFIVADPAGAFNVGRAITSNSNIEVNLGGLTQFGATVDEFHVGTRSGGSSATGRLTLSPDNTIHARDIVIGRNGTAELHLGLSNTIAASRFAVGKDASNADVEITPGGILNLGSADEPTLLTIADQGLTSNLTREGRVDLTGGMFDAHLSGLIVARNSGGNGETLGQLLAGDAGTVRIGSGGNMGDFVVGQVILPGGEAIGTADLSGISDFYANIDQMLIGVGGTGYGTVTLGATSHIDANSVIVGQGGIASGDDGRGMLHLGQTNTILANELVIASAHSNATVDIIGGGSLQLGSEEQPTFLSIADQTTNTNFRLEGSLDLTGGSLDAHLSGLVVGRKSGGPGRTMAHFIAGDGSTVRIGSEGNTADMIVAQRIEGDEVTSTVDFSGVGHFEANLDQLLIGDGGRAFGTVTLGGTSHIDANSIVVGDGGLGLGDDGRAQLHLGQANVIVANEMVIGRDHSTASVDIVGGGTLDLGTAEKPTFLSIADQTTDTNRDLEGALDLTGGSMNAYLSGVVVGRKLGGPGTAVGEWIAGPGGDVTIGNPDARGNVIVGQSVNGGDATGIVDLSTVDSLTAHLDQMLIGSRITGDADADVRLPHANVIDANSIVVGDNATATLRFGETNTIMADQLVVAQGFANATVELPSGATFNLGTHDRRTDLTIGQIQANTNATLSGELDLSQVQVTAYLGNVLIGEKDNLPGTGRGLLHIGPNPDNYVDAEAIRLGLGKGIGTLNLDGGTFKAETITKGAGTAEFNWIGGTLHVDSFGDAVRNFDLDNLGSGRLAPGAAIGNTEVFGSYRQGEFATLGIQIGGNTAGVEHDFVTVSAMADLDGILDVGLYNGFQPSPSDAYSILTANSLTGQFINAPDGAGTLITAFGTWDTSYTGTSVEISNFLPDPLASAASIGTLNGHASNVLGGSSTIGGIDATFLGEEIGTLMAQFDTIDGVDLPNLIDSGVLDFSEPNFALPAGQLQVWDLDFDGTLGPGGATLVFSYDDMGMSLMEEELLDVFHFDDGMWLPVGGVVDTSLNTITATTMSFSPFAIGTEPVPEPSTWLLAGLGFTLIAVFRRHLRR